MACWNKGPAGQVRRRGFTLVEMLVIVAMVLILISIFVPYLGHVREESNKARCQDNLRKIGIALSNYANANGGEFPRVIYDQANLPHGYTSYTGPDGGSAFDAGTSVAANDVTGSLWLLIRSGYIPAGYAPPSKVFICPSTGDWADPMLTAGGAMDLNQRGNFRLASNVSYSYATPFSNAAGYGMRSEFLPHNFVIMADKNPGVWKDSDVTGPAFDAPAEQMMRANSRNHGRRGQSVLMGDMHVEFVTSPYCGVDQDNIYTAVAPAPIFSGIAPDMRSNGHCGTDVGAAWQTDTYLVPTEADGPR